MDLGTLLKDHQLYHSELQQDHFITRRAGGTHYGQYKQALRELFKRWRGLKELYHGRAELEIDIDETEFDLEHGGEGEFLRRRMELKLAKHKGDMLELQKNIQDTEREFKRFYNQAASLKEKIGDLTEEKRRELDKDMWEFKLKEMAALDIMTQGRLSKSTIEFMNSLEVEDRKKLIGVLNAPQSLAAWYQNIDYTYEIKEFECDIPSLISKAPALLEE